MAASWRRILGCALLAGAVAVPSVAWGQLAFPDANAQAAPNPLADPTLALHDGNGTLIGSNDNWQDDPNQAAAITASGLAPTDPLESAISVSLAPGGYTAIVAGKNGGTGVGLVEVFKIP